VFITFCCRIALIPCSLRQCYARVNVTLWLIVQTKNGTHKCKIKHTMPDLSARKNVSFSNLYWQLTPSQPSAHWHEYPCTPWLRHTPLSPHGLGAHESIPTRIMYMIISTCHLRQICLQGKSRVFELDECDKLSHSQRIRIVKWEQRQLPLWSSVFK